MTPNSESKDSRDSKDSKDSKDSEDSKDSKDPKDSKDSKDPKDSKDSKDSKAILAWEGEWLTGRLAVRGRVAHRSSCCQRKSGSPVVLLSHRLPGL